MTMAMDTARRRPSFTIGDRLRKARGFVLDGEGQGLDAQAFAELLGVSRNTVTNYELEKTDPARMKPIVLKQWALAAGVDYDWLVNGDAAAPPDGPDGLEDPAGSKKITVRLFASEAESNVTEIDFGAREVAA